MPALQRTPLTTREQTTSEPTAPKQTALELTLLRQAERRRQIRGLLLLAAVILIFSLLRSGLHNVFTPGWWRLW
jgi:hypothetical protein